MGRLLVNGCVQALALVAHSLVSQGRALHCNHGGQEKLPSLSRSLTAVCPTCIRNEPDTFANGGCCIRHWHVNIQSIIGKSIGQWERISNPSDHYPILVRYSWTKLLSQVGITPHELLQYGSRSAIILPTDRAYAEASRVRQADLLMSEGRIFYGFTAAEFTALLIICGFPPSSFQASGFHEDGQFLGMLCAADGGSFHPVAIFD